MPFVLKKEGKNFKKVKKGSFAFVKYKLNFLYNKILN